MASQPEVAGESKVQVQGDIQNGSQSNGVNGQLNAETLLDLDPLGKGHSAPDVVSENGLPCEVPVPTQNGTFGDQAAPADFGAPLQPDLLSGGESGVPPAMQDAFMTEASEGSQIPPPNLATDDLDPLQGQQSNDLNLVDLDLQPPPPPETDPVTNGNNGNSIDLLADLVEHPPNGPPDLPSAPPMEEASRLDPIQADPIQPEPTLETHKDEPLIQPEPALETHKDEPLIQPEVPDENQPIQEPLVEPEPSQQVETAPPVAPLDLSAGNEVTPAVKSPKKSPKKTIPSPIKKSPLTPKSPKATTPGVDASKIPSPKKEKTTATKAEVKRTPAKPAEKKTPTKPTAGPLRPASAKKDGVDSGIEDDKKETPSSARSLRKPMPLKSATPLKSTSPRSPKPLPSSRTSTSSRSSTEAPGSPSPNTRNARPKVGSLNNARHIPGGGDKKIESQKVEWKAQSKVGSMKNATYKPGGGDKKIESAKLEWKKSSKTDTGKNAPPPVKRQEKKIESKKLEWKAESKIGSMNNVTHKPTGGDKKIESQKLEWKAASKVGSMENASHKPLGGDKKIETVKLEWKAEPKVGSKDNIKHTPGGGEIEIEHHKLDFKEKAVAKTQHKNSPGRSPRMSETSSVCSDK